MGTSRTTGNLLDILERLSKDVRRLKAKLSGTSASLSAWPVGSVFISTDSTNPSTLLGGGTWASFGEGKVLVGVDDSDTDFDTVEETGGAKTHTLTANEMPSHDHAQKVTIDLDTTAGAQRNTLVGGGDLWANDREQILHEGGGEAHNNLQPYITVYMWKRTA